MDLLDKITGLVWAIAAKTSDYTLTENDITILLDGSSNSVTAILPATTAKGRVFFIKSINTTNKTDINPNGNSIDDDSNNFNLSKDEVITVQFDGSNWWII